MVVAVSVAVLLAVLVLLAYGAHRLWSGSAFEGWGAPRRDDDHGADDGVREPRRPSPIGGAAAAAVDPSPDG